MTSYVKNYGMIKNYTTINNKSSVNEAKWIGDYDGNVANVDIDINNNGSVEHAHLQLDNDDLLHILNMASIDDPIEQRLRNDFLLDAPSPNIQMPLSIPTKLQNHINRKRKAKSNKLSIKSNKAKKKTRKIDSLIQLSSL